MNIQELKEKINEGRIVGGLKIKSYALLEGEITLTTTCGIDISLLCDSKTFTFGE